MHRLYALCVGTKTTTRSQFLYRDPSSDPCVIAFYFWLVIAPDGPLLIDCSFGAEEATRRKTEAYVDREALLAACGVAPADIKTVFVTHLHYDHWAGYDLFPNAHFILQARELAFWRGPGLAHDLFASSAHRGAILALDGLMEAGRVTLIDGDQAIAPGLRAHLVGGHTPGLQVLAVDGLEGPAMVASDTFHFYENLRDRRPVQVTVDMLGAIEAMERINELSGDCIARLLPGHDLDVLRRFPQIAPGVVRVA
jgi:glyoxylase-like metal-dependent hydrolase (beta-lactamase superfamily II)